MNDSNTMTYIYLLVNKIIKIFSPAIQLFERRFHKKYASTELRHQPVFIIGAPRTGSTILYQTITNQLDVLYFDNLICGLKNSLMVGFWLSAKIFKNRPHDSFQSYHGNTTKFGSRAPSECGQFWYRWLPADRHFINNEDVDGTMVDQIRSEISSIINYYNKPLVFKNLNAGQRLRLLKKCFPEAKFIFMHREPIYAAQSILLSKRKIGIRDNEFWGIMPRNYKELIPLDPFEQIVKQIYYIEKQIEVDSNLFETKNFINVDYSELGDDFANTIKICQDFIGAKDRSGFAQAEVKISNSIKLHTEEIRKFEIEIKNLNWTNYSHK